MEALNLLHSKDQSILNAATAAIDVIVVEIVIILIAIIAATSFVIMASHSIVFTKLWLVVISSNSMKKVREIALSIIPSICALVLRVLSAQQRQPHLRTC